MSSDNQDIPQQPLAPPSALPDIVKKTPAFVPPRPPVLHPTVGQTAPGPTPPPTNPFAPRKVSTTEKASAPPPAAVPFTDQPLPSALPPPSALTRPAPPSSFPHPVKTNTPEAPKTNIELSPPPTVASPITSPAVLPTVPTETKAVKPEEKKELPEGRVDMTGGLMGWLTKTVTESKLLNDVAEKAKQGMEQVLTTLDPGMRGFLSDDGTVELFVVAHDSTIVRAVKDGFERVFDSVLIKTVHAATGSLPPLVSGSAYSLEVCRDRASRVFASKQIAVNSPLLVMQPFLMQIDNKTYAATRMLLEWRGHLLDSISQLLPVEDSLVKFLEDRAKADGKTAADYSLSLSQAVRESLSVEQESWAGPTPPYSYSELLDHAAASVALQFMNLTLQEDSPAASP